jgi:septal ring factor EnvC (AmiA/AmiB activator)
MQTRDQLSVVERTIKGKEDDLASLRCHLNHKVEQERKLELDLGDSRLQSDSLKHKIMELNDLLDNRERLMMLKDEEIGDLKR